MVCQLTRTSYLRKNARSMMMVGRIMPSISMSVTRSPYIEVSKMSEMRSKLNLKYNLQKNSTLTIKPMLSP